MAVEIRNRMSSTRRARWASYPPSLLELSSREGGERFQIFEVVHDRVVGEAVIDHEIEMHEDVAETDPTLEFLGEVGRQQPGRRQGVERLLVGLGNRQTEI